MERSEHQFVKGPTMRTGAKPHAINVQAGFFGKTLKLLCKQHHLPLAILSSALLPSCLQAADAPQQETTYESLTGNTGTFLWLQQKREEALRKKQQEQNPAQQIAEGEQAPKTQSETPTKSTTTPPQASQKGTSTVSSNEEGALINFNTVAITEVLKYVSRLTGKNFIYDPDELQFSITMISDSETSLTDIMAMLLQSLQIHGFSLIEQGNGFMIHANPDVKGVNGIFERNKGLQAPQIATQVFLLQNVEAERCAVIVRAMLSKEALVEVVESSKIIVSDVAENIKKLAEIIKKLDTQSSGLEIGQYVAINYSPSVVSSLADRIMTPMSGNKPLIFVPHAASNSVFIVSTPYLIERTLAVMQTIDLSQAKSGVLWGEENRFDPQLAEEARKKLGRGAPTVPIPPELSREDIDRLSPEDLARALLARGFTQAQIDALTDKQARDLLWQELNSSEEARRRALHRQQMYADSDLPLGTVEATQFLIYKLQYRNSADVAKALKSIATSLTGGGNAGVNPNTPATATPEIAQSDLVITLNSLQPVDDNNTIVFTGTRASLEKVKGLISQIDVPVRQVFIETLVLDTTLANSLQFGVEWAGKLERPNFGAEVGFIQPDNSTFGPAFGAVTQTSPNPIIPPVGAGLTAGAIGRKIKFQGKGFTSTGGLITALHADNETHIIMNPKVVTEHNVPAEIFVGAEVPIKGQSIANATTGSTSSIVATNYETQQVGILLKVTPLISSHDTVTLIIEQKVSSTKQAEVQAQGQTTAPPATVQETRTTTRVHLPSEYFLVLSGMIQEEKDYINSKIPCLGGLPYIGSLFGVKNTTYNKRNTMIFMRPIIIDTPQDIAEITRNQEQQHKAKSEVNQGWNKEMDDLIELLNL